MRHWLLLIALAGCEHGQSPPGGDDVPDFPDGGPCSKDSFVVGELIDWDSTDAAFVGINGAKVTGHLDPSTGTVTPPNGRLDFCARTDLPLDFDIDAPGDYLDGTLSIEREVLQQMGTSISLRAFTATRATAFFNEQGLIFDPNKAQIVVLSVIDRPTFSLDRAHDAAQSGNDDGGTGAVGWIAGDAGRYVLFPNVDAGATSASLSGDLMSGPRAVPIAPGKLSLVVMAFVIVGP